MRESYGCGRAICVRPRVMRSRGNELDEALTGVRVGLAIEPRNSVCSGSPTQSVYAEGTTSAPPTPGAAGPAGSKNHGTHVDFSHGNREILRSAAMDGIAVRVGNPCGVRRR
jgi:hypothetical protein